MTKLTKFYATIGYGQPDGPGYYIIYASDENSARKIISDHTKGKWSFLYDLLNDVHDLDRKLIAELQQESGEL